MPIDLINIEIVHNNLRTDHIGRTILYRPKTTSTNTEAKKLLEEDCGEGLVIITEEQTEGKGRLQRKWFSPPGGLWFSIVLKPTELDVRKLPIISLLAGVAVAESLSQQFSLKIDLKWPNDIILEGKKLGGILTESIFSGQNLGGVVVGIGLNVNQEQNQFPEELKDTAVVLRTAVRSLEQLSREIILAEILNYFEEQYKELQAGNETEILNKWRKLSTTIGAKVTISLEDEVELIGTAVDLNKSGALIVETDDGEKHTVVAGDCIHLDEK